MPAQSIPDFLRDLRLLNREAEQIVESMLAAVVAQRSDEFEEKAGMLRTSRHVTPVQHNAILKWFGEARSSGNVAITLPPRDVPTKQPAEPSTSRFYVPRAGHQGGATAFTSSGRSSPPKTLRTHTFLQDLQPSNEQAAKIVHSMAQDVVGGRRDEFKKKAYQLMQLDEVTLAEHDALIKSFDAVKANDRLAIKLRPTQA
ncbi:MAG: hypothetical protein JF606_24550 [Burkholderiales bacterium]|jgi:hypothetical protein|nr:hypothetical protein [Burkholderiales bacterium]